MHDWGLRGSGTLSVTWPESVDHALCFGWIDGLRKSVDETRYMIRSTPRKPNSTWSTLNIKRFEALRKQGLVQPAGLAAFGARRENRSGIYSYEQRLADFPDPYAGLLKRRPRKHHWALENASRASSFPGRARGASFEVVQAIRGPLGVGEGPAREFIGQDSQLVDHSHRIGLSIEDIFPPSGSF
jgi:hypothetical protein